MLLWLVIVFYFDSLFKGVSFIDCVEKEDLIVRIQETVNLDPNEIAMKKAALLIYQSKSISCFTGAGMSVESGIPDFRYWFLKLFIDSLAKITRSKGGLWEKYDPNIYASFSNFKSDPAQFWEMMEECKAIILPSKPNEGHKALAELGIF